MKFLFAKILLISIISNHLMASGNINQDKLFLNLLPEDFTRLLSSKNTPRHKPDRKIGSSDFFIKDNFKYALQIKRKKNAITGIYYTCTVSSKCKTITPFRKIFKENQIKLSEHNTPFDGRYLVIKNTNLGITLKFKNNDAKQLYEIIFKKDDVK